MKNLLQTLRPYQWDSETPSPAALKLHCLFYLLLLVCVTGIGAEIKLADGTTVQRVVHANEQGIVFEATDGTFTKRYPRNEIDLSGFPQEWKAKVDEHDAKVRAADQKRKNAAVELEAAQKLAETEKQRAKEKELQGKEEELQRLAKAIENPIETTHKIIIHFPENLSKEKYYIVSNAVFRGLSEVDPEIRTSS
jgi:Skp family chaperone for outer membrane proteins